MKVERRRLSPEDLERLPATRRVISFPDPPKWKGVFENWAKAWVHRHYWKVRSFFGSREDALAECACIFSRCLYHYGEYVDNHKWFMALFKTAVSRDWIDFARKDSRMRTAPAFAPMEQVDYNAGPLIVKLSQIAEVKQALRTLAEAPPEVIAFIFSEAGGARENAARVNIRLKRWSGISGRMNVLEQVKQLLQ